MAEEGRGNGETRVSFEFCSTIQGEEREREMSGNEPYPTLLHDPRYRDVKKKSDVSKSTRRAYQHLPQDPKQLTSLLSFQKLKILKLCTNPISQIPFSNALPNILLDMASKVGYIAGRAILDATVRMAVKRIAEVERV